MVSALHTACEIDLEDSDEQRELSCQVLRGGYVPAREMRVLKEEKDRKVRGGFVPV